MNAKEARKIQYNFEKISKPTEEQTFAFTEAMNFLVETERNPHDMMHLGGYYYEIKRFDLALKYYEMASSTGYEEADACLGYIWYYGRTGEKDYKKAFECFSRSMERGNLQSAYKVADMYKNGYYVEKSFEKYRSIIVNLYKKVKNATYLWEPLPEVFTRLAKIRADEGKTDMAIKLYLKAKDFLAERIEDNAFFGNLNIMNWLINDVYALMPFDKNKFDFFDLYYLMKNQEVKVAFKYGSKQYIIESIKDNDPTDSIESEQPHIKFLDKWYRSIEDFIAKASIENETLSRINTQLFDFEVIE